MALIEAEIEMMYLQIDGAEAVQAKFESNQTDTDQKEHAMKLSEVLNLYSFSNT